MTTNPTTHQSDSYDGRAYAQRGDGFAAWQADGRPWYDVKGRQLDAAGWPTGKMMDGSDEGSTAPPPAETDFGAGARIDVTVTDPDLVTEMPFTPSGAFAGPVWLQAGEGASVGEINWNITKNAFSVVSGNNSSDEAVPFSLDASPYVFAYSLNKAALTDEILAERIAAGKGLAFGTYQLRPAQ